MSSHDQSTSQEQFVKVVENIIAKANASQTEDVERILNKLVQELIASVGALQIGMTAMSKLLGGNRKGGKAKKDDEGEDGTGKAADAPADGAKAAETTTKTVKRAQNTKTLFKDKFSKNVEFRDKYYTEKFKADFGNHPEVQKKKSAATKMSAVAELIYDNIKTNDEALFKQLVAEITTDDASNTVAAEPNSP
ncbi:hypothetical protein F-S17_0067 [Faustovirus]|nr:hypothetical protein F-LCD7_0082 [Faustovirus]QJX71846.1 hypothetical protein F-M6_0083 [Faustovirus]QJX72333.1 hypothetical protein F-S17_0067 [Faustovirus]QJX72843.1 hypothetical protein F-VV57_0081 [Faustovirus]QJX73349.1 hypothetical protein F-VV63_0083 [Faustovirus]